MSSISGYAWGTHVLGKLIPGFVVGGWGTFLERVWSACLRANRRSSLCWQVFLPAFLAAYLLTRLFVCMSAMPTWLPSSMPPHVRLLLELGYGNFLVVVPLKAFKYKILIAGSLEMGLETPMPLMLKILHDFTVYCGTSVSKV